MSRHLHLLLRRNVQHLRSNLSIPFRPMAHHQDRLLRPIRMLYPPPYLTTIGPGTDGERTNVMTPHREYESENPS